MIKQEKLGHLICHLMQQKGLHVRELSRASKIPVTVLTACILTHHLPPDAQVRKLAESLGTTKGRLIRATMPVGAELVSFKTPNTKRVR